MDKLIPTIALSFSRLSDYETCPLKFKQKYIDKTYPDDSDNVHFKKGNEIHSQLENYINFISQDDMSEPSMNHITSKVKPLIESIYKASGGQMFSEKQIAVDQNWKKCDWFAKPSVVKYRAIIDFMAFMPGNELLLGDWKSGKVREYEDGPTTQLKLTAAICFNLFPKIEKITTAYFFVEHSKTVKISFTRDQLEDLMNPFNEAHYVVNTATEFPHKKNRYCNFCLSEDCPIKI